MSILLLLAWMPVLTGLPDVPAAGITAQTVVGGNCSRHGPWRGSSDCPGCLRERNTPPPPPPPPRVPTEEELREAEQNRQRVAEMLQRFEDQREQRRTEARQRLESDKQE